MNLFSQEKLEKLLILESKKCNAPVTGYRVACCFITNKDIYLGHNNEKENPVIFEHAETLTIKRMLKKEKFPIINKIIMLGSGNVKKLKYCVPCYSCTQMLTPYVSDNTIISLMPLPNSIERLEISFKELIESYDDLPYSKIESTNPEEISLELKTKTILKDKDIEFIKNMRLLGLNKKINLYLTGSSTGRGAASTLLIKKTNTSYRDLDLIIVIQKSNYDSIEKDIENIIKNNYGSYIKENRPVVKYNNKEGAMFKKTFYYHGQKQNELIDVTFATSFKGSFNYQAYELKLVSSIILKKIFLRKHTNYHK